MIESGYNEEANKMISQVEGLFGTHRKNIIKTHNFSALPPPFKSRWPWNVHG